MGDAKVFGEKSFLLRKREAGIILTEFTVNVGVVESCPTQHKNAREHRLCQTSRVITGISQPRLASSDYVTQVNMLWICNVRITTHW